MLLSRFWYVVLAVALGAVLFALFLSTSMYDRAAVRAMGEALAGDSQVVGSFLRDDARRRASALIVPALDDDIRTHLAKSSTSLDKIPNDSKDKVRAALRKHFNNIPAEQKFDALFALDQSGRVIGEVGFDQSASIEGFELGGYPVVADALHGWVRDDTWVLAGRLYRVVARPVEHDVTQMPAGAIVGVRILDDTFARELSRRTSAAVAFYANGARVSSGAPEGFDATQLDTVTAELKTVEADPTYKEKGFSDVRTLHDNLGVVYSRLMGEAWDLGAGYVVARMAHPIGSPLGFLNSADDKDKRTVPLFQIILISLLVAGVGLGLELFRAHPPAARVSRRGAAFRQREGRAADGEQVPGRLPPNRRQPQRRYGARRGQRWRSAASRRSRCGARADAGAALDERFLLAAIVDRLAARPRARAGSASAEPGAPAACRRRAGSAAVHAARCAAAARAPVPGACRAAGASAAAPPRAPAPPAATPAATPAAAAAAAPAAGPEGSGAPPDGQAAVTDARRRRSRRARAHTGRYCRAERTGARRQAGSRRVLLACRRSQRR